MGNCKVKVVVPLYRPLSEEESLTLVHNARVLGDYPLVLLAPEGLDTAPIAAKLPFPARVERVVVPPGWLGSRNGIAGYNDMMLSADFYALFGECDYILVCQTDVWIFRDELAAWCERGYDYVGAPWLRRPVYDLPLVKQYLALRRHFCSDRLNPLRQSLYGRVGNGGLSLRKVESHRKACVKYASERGHFLSVRHHLHNEDVFWATIPEEFLYPSAEEALQFAFDTNPAYCLRLTGGNLPFGAHSWNKRRYRGFWAKYIPLAR